MNKILLITPWLKTTDLFLIKENIAPAPFVIPAKAGIQEKNKSTFSLEKSIKIEVAKEENKEIFSFLNSVDLNEISKILICNWPWRFMSMRICWTIVNTIKNQFPEIEIYQVPTYEFLQKKSENSIILLQLNQTEILYFWNWKVKKITFKDLNELLFKAGFPPSREWQKVQEWQDEQEWQIKWFWNVRHKLKLPENFEEEKNWKNSLEILNYFFKEKYKTSLVKIIY